MPAAALTFAVATSATAQTPSAKIGTGSLVSPSSFQVSAYNGSATNDLYTGTYPREVIELGRALGSGRTDAEKTDIVYRYVRDNMKIAWMFGLQKGALGAIVDRSGTAFDQANLMVETLRQQGVTASYQFGTITLSGAQFEAWSGVTSAQAACQLLAAGGIPASINNSTIANCAYGSSTSISSITLAHVWVSVSLGGTSYVFDPAYKPHALKTQAAGLSGVVAPGQPVAAAAAGMESNLNGGVPYVRSLNSANLETQLATYAGSVQGIIEGGYSTAKIEDVIGGAVLQRSDPAQSLRQTTLPYSSSVLATWAGGGLPDKYRTTVTVTVDRRTNTDSIVTIFPARTLFVDEIYGRKLTAISRKSPTLLGENRDVLRLVDEFGGYAELRSYTATTQDNPNFNEATVTVAVNHPYPDAAGSPSGTYMDETVVKSVKMWMPLTIVTGFGDAGPGFVDKWGARDDSEAPAIHETDDPCSVTDTCSLYEQAAGDGRREQLAAAWLVQSSRASQLHAALAGSIFTHHHSIGVVSADTQIKQVALIQANPVNGPQGFLQNDAFDRIDINSAISLTSKTANAVNRRAGVHAIVQTMELLEGSVAAQISDLPDTASVVTRFAWGNAPPPTEDNKVTGVSPGPRRFYAFPASTSVPPDLTKFEGFDTAGATVNNDNIQEPVLDTNDAGGFRSRLQAAIQSYVQAGFNVVTSEESLLGPGQRAGARIKQPQPNAYSHLQTFQRGGALAATKYDAAGDPVEIALVTVGQVATAKGGGGGAQGGHQAQYNPSKAADVLKSRFVDRSSAVGVDLLNGRLTYSSPAGLDVGAGEFPDKLSLQIFWRGGERKGGFRPPGITEPQTPWSTNWHNTLTASGSGMEAMGATDVRATGGTIAAFLAMQDVYRSAPSAQREVTAALVGAWWAKQLTFNVVTVNVGSGSQQFVRRYDGGFFAPGPGRYATLTQSNDRQNRVRGPCNDVVVPWVQTRGWDYRTVGFVVTNANGDRQTFVRWENKVHTGPGGRACMWLNGWRLATWEFPKGVTVNLRYESVTDDLDRLAEVSNTLGRHIDFIYQGGLLSGFSDRTRSISMSMDPTGGASFTDAAGKVTTVQATYVGGWAGLGSSGIGARYQLNDVFAADALSGPAALHYDYDTMGRVKQARDRLSLMDSTLRPAHQFLIGHGLRGERIDPAGGRYAVDYDEDKHPLRFVDEIGRVVSATYDGRGRTRSYTYPEGDREELEYDARNNQTVMRKLPKPGSAEAVANQKIEIAATWDPTFNKITTLTDAKGQLSSFSYFPSGNGKGEMAFAVRPNGATYAFQYNVFGQLVSSTDPTGVNTQIAYDGTSHYPTVTTLDPGGVGHVNAITTATYNPIGDPVSINGPRGDVNDISYVVYDNLRRKTLEVQPFVNGAGAATQTVYNDVGWVTSVSQGSATGTAPAFTFTPVVTTTNAYDAVGNKTQVSTPVTVTQISYDRLNRTECTATRMNGSAADPCALSPQGTFGPDQISKNLYDLAGQLLSTRIGLGTDAETAFVTKEYTPNGQPQFVIDGNCNVTKLEYDGFDRLKAQFFPEATLRGAGCVAPGNAPSHAGAFSLSDVERYGYDLNGNRTNLTKRDGTQIVSTFDNVDRKIQQIVNGGSPSNDVYFTYDPADRMTSARRDGFTGKGILYEYDSAGRLVKDKAFFWEQTIYTLDTAGNRTKITWPDGGVADFVYDAANRMSEIRQPGQAAALITFAYDAQGRRTGLSRSNGASAAYQYVDPAGRLTRVSQIGAGNTLPSIQAITYTPASQIRTLAQDTLAYVWQGQPLATKSLSHDGLNRDATIAVLPNGYDKNGNVTNSGVRSYNYDTDNRVILQSDGTNSMGLAYDPLGRLRATQTSAGVWTYFLYAGEQLIGEYELKTEGAAALRRYIHGPGLDEPVIAYQRNGSGVEQTSWLHADRQGSIIASSNASGVVTPYSYGPYGEPNDWTGPRFRYTGQVALPEMQAYYYKARIYDPAMGRFLQTDPIGQADDPNLYAYVAGDPVNNSDPDGTVCISRANSGSVQCQRSALYAGIHSDPRISSKTTFFAGASLVTAALANKDLPGGGRFVNASTSNFIDRMGGALKGQNLSMAAQIRAGNALTGSDRAANDRMMVHREQTMVQGFLDSERGSNPNYAGAIAQINSLLNGDAAQLATRFSDPAFAAAVGETRRELGRAIDFSKQSDRERIGNNVMENQRGSCTGTRICR